MTAPWLAAIFRQSPGGFGLRVQDLIVNPELQLSRELFFCIGKSKLVGKTLRCTDLHRGLG
jgi:hypothetical protein